MNTPKLSDHIITVSRSVAYHNILWSKMGNSLRRGTGAVAIMSWLCSGGLLAQSGPEPTVVLPMEPLWTTTLLSPPAAAPVYETGRLFVALRDGHMTALNLSDGDVVWQVLQRVDGQPVVGGGLLYLVNGGELFALDTTTGGVNWSISLGASLSAPLIWNAGWLIVSLDTQTLLALRAETGETVWRRKMGDNIHAAPSFAAERMFVPLVGGAVVVLSLLDGEAVWERPLEGTPSQILPLDDVFVGATDNYFYRLSAVDGSIKWRWRTGGDVVGLAAVDEERVYFTSLDNMLWALNRKSGVQQWRQPLAARPNSGPSSIGDLLVLGGVGENLHFFHPVTGDSYGQIPESSELAFPPLNLSTQQDRLFLITVTGDGRLRTLHRANGPVKLDLASVDFLREETAGTGVDGDVAEPNGVESSITQPAVSTERNDTVGGQRETRELSEERNYAIQFVERSNASHATELVELLLERGFPAYVVGPESPEEGEFYQVRVGHYSDSGLVRMIGRQIDDEMGFDWDVVLLP